MMHLDDFDYTLPETLVAQTPIKDRDQSRLMVVNKHTLDFTHNRFSDISTLLPKNAMLVFNDTKVINARLFAKRSSGAAIELFLLEPLSETRWKALIKPSRRVKVGEELQVSSQLRCTVIAKNDNGEQDIELHSENPIYEVLETEGNVPLPPYISASKVKEANQFKDRYQTVLAKYPGAVAAPTAGLHFTESLLSTLKAKGIDLQTITLHVGYGTFKPISDDSVVRHKMHYEPFYISPTSAEKLTKHKQNGDPIIAVGTTSTRSLEAAWNGKRFQDGEQETNLFIYPGYTFGAIDGLITNFHLPKSSLMVLVSALAGTKLIQKAYKEAVQERYRFYSFGDAMYIQP